MSRRKKIAVREEEDGYKYPLTPNGHLSAAVPHCGSAAPIKTVRVRVKFRLSLL